MSYKKKLRKSGVKSYLYVEKREEARNKNRIKKNSREWWRGILELRKNRARTFEQINRALYAGKVISVLEQEYYAKLGREEVQKLPRAMRNGRNLKKALEKRAEQLLEQARDKEKKLGKGASFVNTFFEPKGPIEVQIGELKEINRVLDKALEEEEKLKQFSRVRRKHAKKSLGMIERIEKENEKYFKVSPELKKKVRELKRKAILGEVSPKLIEEELQGLREEAEKKAELILKIDKKVVEAGSFGIKPPAIIGNKNLVELSPGELEEMLRFAEKKVEGKKLEVERLRREKAEKEKMRKAFEEKRKEFERVTGEKPRVRISKKAGLKDYEKAINELEERMQREKERREMEKRKELEKGIEERRKELEKRGEKFKITMPLEKLSTSSLEKIMATQDERLEKAKEKERKMKEIGELFYEIKRRDPASTVKVNLKIKGPLDEQLEELEKKKKELEETLSELKEEQREEVSKVARGEEVPIGRREERVAKELKKELYLPEELAPESKEKKKREAREIEENQEAVKKKTKQEEVLERFRREHSDIVGELAFSGEEKEKMLSKLDELEEKAKKGEITPKKLERELEKWLKEVERKKKTKKIRKSKKRKRRS